MTEKFELYKCEICGNLVEVLIPGEGELVCCGKPMKLLTENTQEPEKGEAHIPYVYKNEEGKTIIQVGKTLHPMIPEHYIQLIQVISNDGMTSITKFLKPEDEPVMSLKENCEDFSAREICSIHGLWVKK